MSMQCVQGVLLFLVRFNNSGQFEIYGVTRSSSSRPFLCALDICDRPYAFDVITHITKHEMDGWRKIRYCATILSGKSDHSLWSICTAEWYASSFLTGRKWFCHYTQNAQGLLLKWISLPAWLVDTVSLQTVLKLHRLRSSLPLKMAA